MAVANIEGQRKLNQHKPDADHASVVRALEQAGGNALDLTRERDLGRDVAL